MTHTHPKLGVFEEKLNQVARALGCGVKPSRYITPDGIVGILMSRDYRITHGTGLPVADISASWVDRSRGLPTFARSSTVDNLIESESSIVRNGTLGIIVDPYLDGKELYRTLVGELEATEGINIRRSHENRLADTVKKIASGIGYRLTSHWIDNKSWVVNCGLNKGNKRVVLTFDSRDGTLLYCMAMKGRIFLGYSFVQDSEFIDGGYVEDVSHIAEQVSKSYGYDGSQPLFQRHLQETRQNVATDSRLMRAVETVASRHGYRLLYFDPRSNIEGTAEVIFTSPDKRIGVQIFRDPGKVGYVCVTERIPRSVRDILSGKPGYREVEEPKSTPGIRMLVSDIGNAYQ